MSSVDQRIVEMRFDNKQFESGVSTTLSTLDKLKKALNLPDAGKGLDELSGKANKFSMHSVQSAVETVSERFSALGIIGMTALQNITNKAVDAGEKIVKALTIDPVKMGFDEYELKMDSIKVMLSNTNGKNSLEEIKDVLEELNKYADDTIYNFGQMTSAMGKMTAQGIDLYDAEEAVRGLSNLAALVGSGSQEYTNAMNYGLVQALAMGQLRLQDWKSFENANISSKVFRDELIKTAFDLGYFDKDWTSNQGQTIKGLQLMHDANTQFRETLKYGWVDNDVLLTTLSKFADTTSELGKRAQDAAREVRTVTKLKDQLLESLQSGWAYTWEYIIGDVNEATEVLTKISDALTGIFNKAADERNEAFRRWHDNPIDGRSTFISAFEKIWGYFTQILKVFDRAKEIVFGNDALFNLLTNITHWLDNFAYNLDWSGKKAVTLQNIFTGALSIIDMAFQGLSATWRTIKPIFGLLEKPLSFIFDILGKIGKRITDYNAKAKAGDKYYRGLQLIADGLKNLKPYIDYISDKIQKFDIGKVFENAKAKVDSLKNSFKEYADQHPLVATAFDKIKIALQPLTDLIEKAIDRIKGLGKAFGLIKSEDNLIDYFDGNSVVEYFDNINSAGDIVKIFKTKVKEGLSGAIEWFEKLIGLKITLPEINFGSLKASFENIKNQVKSYFDDLSKNQTFASLKTSIETTFSNAFDKVTEIINNANLQEKFDSIGGWVQSFFDKIDKNLKDFDFASFMDSLLEKAEKIFDFFNSSNEEKIETITGVFNKFVDVVIGNEEATGSFDGFIKKLQEFKEMAQPVLDKLIETFGNFENLERLGVISILFGFAKALFGVGKTAKQTGKLMKNSAKVVGGFEGLGETVKGLFTGLTGGLTGGISGFFDSLKTIATGLTETLGGIGKAIKAFSRNQNASAILKISLAIGALSVALIAIGKNLSWDQMQMAAQGLTLVAGVVTVVAIAYSNFANTFRENAKYDAAKKLGEFLESIQGSVEKFLNRVSFAAFALGLSISVSLLASAVKKLGSLSWNDAIKGVGSLGVIIAILVKALNKVDMNGGASLGKAAMAIGLALGVKSVVNTMRKVSKMGLGEIVKGLGTVGTIMFLLSRAIKRASIGEGSLGKAAMILAVSRAVKKIASSLGMLAKIPLEKVPQVMGLLAEIFIGLDTALIAAKGISKHWGTVLMLGLVIGELGLIAAGMSFLDAEKLLTASEAMSLMMAAFAGMEFGAGQLKGSVKSIFMLGIIVAEMAVVLWALDQLDIQHAKETADAMSEMVLAFSGACTLLSIAGKGSFVAALKGIAIMDLVIADLIAVMEGIGLLFTNDLFGEAAFNTFIAGCEKLGNGIGAFIGGIKSGYDTAVTKNLPTLGENLNAFGESAKPFFDMVGTLGDNAFTGLDFLDRLGDAIPKSGGLLQGFFGEVKMDEFGNNLKSLGDGLKYFAETTNGITVDGIGGSVTVAEALANLNSSLPPTDGLLQDWLGQPNLRSFGNSLVFLGNGLRKYSDSISIGEGIDTKLIARSASAAEALAKLNDILPPTDGILQDWLGQKSLKTFGDSIWKFAIYLRRYSNIITGADGQGTIDSTAVEASAKAATMLADLANTIPDQDSIFDTILGSKDLGSFGSTLEEFGQGIKKYSDAISEGNGIDDELITKSSKAAESLAALNNKLPKSGGKLQDFLGEKSFQTFGEQLIYFGYAIKAYNDAISSGDGISTSLIEDSATAADALVELSTGLEPMGGLWQELFGEKSLSLFGTSLTEFAQALIDYQGKLSEVKFDELNKAIPFLEDMVNVAKMTNDIADWNTDIFNNVIGQIITVAATAVDEFTREFGNETNTNTLDAAGQKAAKVLTDAMSTAIDGYKTDFGGKATDLVGEFTSSTETAVEGKKTNIKNSFTIAFSEAADAAISEISKRVSQFEAAIESICNAILNKIRSHNQEMYNVGIGLINEFIRGINFAQGAVVTTGENTALGLVNGMYNRANEIVTSARNLGTAVVNALNSSVQTRSPSRLTTKTGENIDLGLINGMNNLLGRVVNTSSDVGEEAATALTNPIKLINDVLAMDIDATPTIAPVMDLTNIDSGINEINSLANRTNLLFGNATVANIKGVGSIASNPVQLSIDGLRGDIGSLNSTLRNSMNGENTGLLNDMIALMNRYFPEFASGQVVLDSGETVGVLTPKINNEMRKLYNRSR